MANTDHLLLPQLLEPCVALHHYRCIELHASAPVLALLMGRWHLADFLFLVATIHCMPLVLPAELFLDRTFVCFYKKVTKLYCCLALCGMDTGQKQSGLLDDLSSNEVYFLHSENVWVWFCF